MKVSAKLNNLRIAPRKTRLVGNLVKGLDVQEALNQLEVNVRSTCPHLKKLLKSAIANGENNFGIDRDNMYILDVVVEAGPSLKRWMPKAYGRAGKILKRTSKIELILEERIEGKGRKSREQMEKEKKKRLEDKKKEQKEMEEKEKATLGGKEKAETQNRQTERAKEIIKEKKSEERGKGIINKIFRRKSM